MGKRRPDRFFTDSDDGKVKPMFFGPQAATPLRTPKTLHPSREQVHQLRQAKLDEFREFEAAVEQQLNDINAYGKYRQELKKTAMKEHAEHPWTSSKQATLIALDHVKAPSDVELIHYCKCGQAVRLRKRDATWVHYGYKRMHEPYSDYLKRTDHPVVLDMSATRTFPKGKSGSLSVLNEETGQFIPVNDPSAAKLIEKTYPLGVANEDKDIKEMHVTVPKGTKVVVHEKPHNPAEIELKDLASPYSGAPLEPASEYGSSIMYDPYSGRYVMVSVPEARLAAASKSSNPGVTETYVVKPRFTEVQESSLKIAKSFIKQAADEVRDDSSPDAIRRASQRLSAAGQQMPWANYHGAGLEKDPVWVNLQRNGAVISSYVQGMREAESGSAEEQRLASQAREHILALSRAIAGEE